ncbi:citrate synthase [Desulfonispora thiosulfatigenes DSM 11270]|uniref:Citrate synthase n=1 Tax=Desulfonispora thiosulfatigenes DSM 11270 TaxID=656914 RepID=A0A1W1ULR0_DESTI|nr:citrate/2-methylcitrate synthase [Desulfonispora thiosulfatigenes]SMB81741.1 citrate synthase [Desulfonispora thiosulfatigenes DSM 11270]
MSKINHELTKEITEIILKAKEKATRESSGEPDPKFPDKLEWPISCTIGPGLEGAIACETKIGYVNGSKGWLIYQGYDIFDLCAYSTFEEVSYLLIHGKLPNDSQLESFKKKLARYRDIPETIRMLTSFPVEEMSTMAALRLGSELMRQNKVDEVEELTDAYGYISSDEDSIPMETNPMGEKKAIYEFDTDSEDSAELIDSCYQAIAGLSSILGAISRLRSGYLPLEPKDELSHAANLIYMMTGKEPTPLEERIMDICLILHADHGMNASTFATIVVASTLSDLYFSIGAGIAALNGPLHGGANEEVVHTLNEIGSVDNVKAWYEQSRKEGRKISGFGHRVYKAYDPRARILEPLAKLLVENHPEMKEKYEIAQALEDEVVNGFGKEKKIFPNVDFYSGIVYKSLGIQTEYYTPIFGASRVSGWAAHVVEYLKKNRIFRPRGIYVGEYGKEYEPIETRD